MAHDVNLGTRLDAQALAISFLNPRACTSSPARQDSAEPHLQAMQASFRRAVARNPEQVIEEWWALAGVMVRVHVAGRALWETWLKALAHLRVDAPPGRKADLTIELWDESMTGVGGPEELECRDARGRWAQGEGELVSSHSGRYFGYRLDHSECWLDRETPRLIGRTTSASRLILFERGKPLQFLLNLWLSDRHLQVIHSGLVAKDGHGLLFPGTGGAGKTTSSLSCLIAGLDYLGDDYIALDHKPDGSFVGYSLYNTTWLEPAPLNRFPGLVPHAGQGLLPGARKKLVLLADVYPERIRRSVPIRALALPRIVDAPRATWRPATMAEALLKIMPSSLLHIVPRPGQEGLERLAALVEKLPCYWLELGRDLPSIPEAAAELLAHAIRAG